MVKDNRRYYLDLKENSRGRFLRVILILHIYIVILFDFENVQLFHYEICVSISNLQIIYKKKIICILNLLRGNSPNMCFDILFNPLWTLQGVKFIKNEK